MEKAAQFVKPGHPAPAAELVTTPLQAPSTGQMTCSGKTRHFSARHRHLEAFFLILLVLSAIFSEDNHADPAKPIVPESNIRISGIPASNVAVGFARAMMHKNLSDAPVSIAGQTCRQAIFAHAPSRLSFTTQRQFRYFKAKLGIDSGVAQKGRVRFFVFVDGKSVYASGAVSGGEPPIPLVLDIGGSNKIELVVDPLGENSYDHSVWCEPEFSNRIPDGWQLTSGQGSMPGVEKNVLWDTGDKTFPSERGLFVWNAIAATFYLLLFVLAVLKRNRIYSCLRNSVPPKTPENAILLLAAAICFWVFSPFWKDGLPASWDAGQHYFRCWLMKNLFLANFTIDGWSPYWNLGVQQFLFYSPLLFVLIVLFHLFTFQLVPLVLCFKLFFFLVYLGLPFACYWLMRQFKIDPIPAALAALGVPAISAIHGIGIESLFEPGLMTQGFGLLIFCVALGLLRRIKDEENGFRSTLMLGLSLGILFLGHIITSVYFVFCAALFALFYLSNKRILRMLTLSIVLGGALAAFALWPTFNFRELRGPEVGWGEFDGLRLMLAGNYFGSAFLNATAIVGLFIVIFNKDKDFKIISVLAFVTYVLASGYVSLPDSESINTILTQIFKSRTFPYLGIYLVMLCGVFYQSAFQYLSRTVAGSGILRRLGGASTGGFTAWITLALVLLVMLGSAGKLVALKAKVKLDSDFAGVRREAFIDGFNWMRVNTPQNMIVAFDERGIDAGDLGFNQFASQINIHSNRYTLQGNQFELTRAHNEDVARNLAAWPPQRLYEYLTRYNVSYLYTWNDDVVKNLSQSPDRFRIVYRNEFISIWQIGGYDFRYLSNSGIEIKNFHFSPEKMSWRVANTKANNVLTAAVVYHPNWRLFVNGSEAAIGKTEDHLIAFSLPQEGKLYELELRFEKSNSEKMFCYLSFAALLLVLFFLSRTGERIGTARR